jgi:hypothetical protein
MMKLIMTLFLALSLLTAKNNSKPNQQNPQVGDIYEIGKPETRTYRHINFPKPNFIIKKGGVANYKLAVGKKVIVTSVKKKKDGTNQVTIKREDGGRFFGSHTFISANFEEALEAGELQF